MIPVRPSRRFFAFSVAGFAALLLATLYGAHLAGRAADRAVRERLIERARLVAALLSPEEYAALPRVPGMSCDPLFRSIRAKFTAACDTDPEVRYIYLIERQEDGLLHFLMDSQPTRFAGRGKPVADSGELYDDAPPEFVASMEAEATTTFGPYADKWGEFITGVAPFRDTAGNLIALVGIDITTDEWRRQVVAARAAALLAGFVAVLLFAVWLLIRYRREESEWLAGRRFVYQRAILDLIRQENSDYLAALERMCAVAAAAAGCDRVNFWLYEPGKARMRREACHDRRGPEAAAAGLAKIDFADYPGYFAALDRDRRIAAADARRDPRTAEFAAAYLVPQEVVSLLDVQVWLHGRAVGVVCLETRERRAWCDADLEFAGALADFAALVVETGERVLAERHLADSTRYLESILDRVPDPIFVKDATHRFVLVNEALAHLFGRPREAILWKRDEDFLPPDQVAVFLEHDRRVLETGEEDTNEEELTDASGCTRIVHTRKSRYVDDTGAAFVVGVIRDVTERKRMEAEALRASKLESLGLLAGGIAHDFNNLLTALVGNLGLARRLAGGDPRLAEVLARSEATIERAKGLSQQLITFSKGGRPVKKLARLEETVRGAAQFALAGGRTPLRVEVPGDLWPVECDEGQIAQVVTNLVINAAQASPPGGVVGVRMANLPAAEGASAGYPARDGVAFPLPDEGPGIPREDLARIFDPYFTTKKGGSGLGLTTSYSIVRGHEGVIRVESEPGRGASFTVWLPARPAPR